MKNKKYIIIVILILILLIILATVVFNVINKNSGIFENISNKNKSSNWTLTKGEGLLGTTNTGKQIEIGDIITLKTESFYIIKVSETKVSALSVKNLNLTTKIQSDSYTGVQFDENSPNYEGSNIQGIVNDYVSTTLNGKAKGRLMTLEEIISLNGNANKYTTSICPYWINKNIDADKNLSYWLGTAYEGKRVWNVNGKYSQLSNTSSCNYVGAISFGVRPVIDVNLSDIH